MKKIFITSLFLIFLLITPSLLKGQENKFSIAFNSGYSFGLSALYKSNVGAGIKSQTKLGFNFGANIQYFLSRYLGIQGEIEFQTRNLHRESMIPEVDYKSTHDESFVNYLLNIILLLNNSRKNRFSVYLFSSIGIMAGKGAAGFVGRIGGGLKYNFSQQVSLNLRLPFTYEESDFNPLNPSYFSSNIGLEYRF